MNNDLISREALKKKFGYTDEWYKSRSVTQEIDNDPTVEITEEQAIDKLHETGWLSKHDKEMTKRPKGEWLMENKLYGGYGDGVLVNTCSICKTSFIYRGKTQNFCSNCGADMRGEEE